MTELQNIQTSYGFKDIKWEIERELIRTEKGVKRLNYWNDENLARWHLKWRDRIFERTGCLTDRMIQTVNGERILLLDTGWITLHDEVTSLFSYQNSEKDMGELLGSYYNNELDEAYSNYVEYSMNTFQEDTLKKLEFSEEEKADPVLDSLRKESLLRVWKAKRLLEKVNRLELPVVCPIQSIDQGKLIYGKLFWRHTTGLPEKGYRSLKLILSQWLQRYGKSSLFSLLTEINKHFILKENDSGILLLVECLLPWELIQYMEQMKGTSDENEVAMRKERLTYEWENCRALVQALSKWLHVNEEKVSV